MEMKTKIYKRVSIISFTIVLMLIASLILPIFINAEQEEKNNDFTMQFNVNKVAKLIRLTGSIPSGYSKYELYWANKEYTREVPTKDEDKIKYVNDTIEWYKDSENKLIDVITVEGNTSINSSYVYVAGNSYSVLCLVYDGDNIRMMNRANYISSSSQEISAEEITLNLSANNKTIMIKASDASAKITSIKIEKSDAALKTEDFASRGKAVTGFESSNNVTASITVDDYGVYYICAENEQGYKVVDGIILKNPTPPQDADISLELYRITDSNYGDFAVKAKSKKGKISTIKYYVSDSLIDLENEENRNNVKSSGTPMNVSGDNAVEEIVKSDGDIKDEKYITFFVQSTDGTHTYEYWSNPGTIGGIEKVAVAPWENGKNTNSSESKVEDFDKPNSDDDKTENITDTANTANTTNTIKPTNTTKPANTTNATNTTKSTNTTKPANTTNTTQYNSNNPGTYDSGNSNKNKLPQTGSNSYITILGIIVFSILGITGLVKYKKEK